MNSYWIRTATRQDAPSLALLLTELGHRTSAAQVAARWNRWAEAGNWALVATHPERGPVGVVTLHRMAVLHRPAPVGRITALFVERGSRGLGIGRSLVEAAESALAAAKCGLVEVTSHHRFAEAHFFYERLGYARTSVRFAKSLGGRDERS